MGFEKINFLKIACRLGGKSLHSSKLGKCRMEVHMLYFHRQILQIIPIFLLLWFQQLAMNHDCFNFKTTITFLPRKRVRALLFSV